MTVKTKRLKDEDGNEVGTLVEISGDPSADPGKSILDAIDAMPEEDKDRLAALRDTVEKANAISKAWKAVSETAGKALADGAKPETLSSHTSACLSFALLVAGVIDGSVGMRATEMVQTCLNAEANRPVAQRPSTTH